MVAEIKDPQMKTAAILVTGVLSDLQLLVEQQFQLTRCELEQELRQRAGAAVVFGAGLGGCFLGAFMLSLAAAHAIHWSFQSVATDTSGVPLWACECMVAVALGVIGTVLLFLGCRHFREITFNQSPATELFRDAK